MGEFPKNKGLLFRDDRIGDVQAILIDPETGKLYGAADSPRPGQARGVEEED
ncbi:hypothetical protein [Gracilibacillus oryzae]|uniref:hypothetical protein n=1 Tax=Gracilibacillus oryzae TaxID=1672701 RepID=UPI001294ACE3|nr:hypothetical protein [Gracilibacillus oryzae]